MQSMTVYDCDYAYCELYAEKKFILKQYFILIHRHNQLSMLMTDYVWHAVVKHTSVSQSVSQSVIHYYLYCYL